jgi:hypothetical protein
MAVGELAAQLGVECVGVAVQAAAGDERDRVDYIRMGKSRPRGLREVKRRHTDQSLALTLTCLF